MRPAGDISQAVLAACRELTTPERAPTLAEITARACLSRIAALYTVRNLARSGQIVIPRTRKVTYRNRPVAEYAPAPAAASENVDLAALLSAWGRQAG
jgi:hypothetical protein